MILLPRVFYTRKLASLSSFVHHQWGASKALRSLTRAQHTQSRLKRTVIYTPAYQAKHTIFLMVFLLFSPGFKHSIIVYIRWVKVGKGVGR